MAEAVTLWSPVIMMGRMPAATHDATACFDSSRGGSIMAMSPRKSRPFSSDRLADRLSMGRQAKASTRRPSRENRSLTASTLALPSAEMTQRSSSTSTAPLVTIR